MYRWILVLTFALMWLVACAPAGSPGPKVRIENAWARPAAASTMSHSGMLGNETTSAAYLTVVNEGNEADVLIEANAQVASKVELHETRMEGDIAKMMPVPRVDVPARGRVEFKPGGLHIMLTGVSRDLNEGETFMLTLKFEKSGGITMQVPVREAK